MDRLVTILVFTAILVSCSNGEVSTQLPVHSCSEASVVCPYAQTSAVPLILTPWYEGEVQHTIDLDSLFGGGPPKDGIPAVDTPVHVSLDAVDFLTDESRGVLLEIDGDIRFYPYAILNWHEIVNDTVGNVPVSVTYCPLCATAVVFQRGESSFGVSGLLYNSNLLMYDRETLTLWNQLSGTAVVGPNTGDRLLTVPSSVTSFGRVKNTEGLQVLSPATGFKRNYKGSPYVGYDEEPEISFPVENEDSRLPTKELVYGLEIDGEAVVYPASVFTKQVHIDDEVAGKTVSVFVNAAGSIAATVDGEPTHILPVYWFAWVAQYPETLIYSD